MAAVIKAAIPAVPSGNTEESLRWWTEVCGFEEASRDATPPAYAGIRRDNAELHITGMDNRELARKVGDQTMVRLRVVGIEEFYEEFQRNGGAVHPNGSLQAKPWGTKEFSTVDPNGVCVSFQE